MPASLVRYRDPLRPWRARARKALDQWSGSSEGHVAIALVEAYRDGIKKAAAFVEEKGQCELATLVRRLTEEEPPAIK